MLNWVFGNKRSEEATKKAPPYEQARETASNGSTAERTSLAECQDLPPEFLYYFASDKDDAVRTAVAANPGTPLQADVILAKDREVTVRTVLANKIAKILPDIRADQSEKLAELAFEVLEILADDQAAQVRHIVAESIKSLDNVPKPIVQLLARDLDEVVSMPVLEFSPLLNEQDLLDLVLTGIRGKKLAAVSRREDLTVELIDAIVDTDDEIAVEALIENEQADIPNRTFDAIVDGAEKRERWQSALASRDRTPTDILQRLSRFATESVLKRLKERSDLGAELHAELASAVVNKVEEKFEEDTPKEEKKEADLEAEALSKARQMYAAGELTEAVVLDAISKKDRTFMDAVLAVLAGQKAADIRSLLKMNSAKSILALSWHCGLSMKSALAIQEKVVRLPADKVMRASAGGNYPLSEEDLSWQAELLFD